MAEPLKNQFGPDVIEAVADMIAGVYPAFDHATFVADAADGFDGLELTDRARRIAAAMANHLPADRRQAIDILTESLGDPIDGNELSGMESFRYLPHVYFVADHGLDHYDAAMRLQYEVTQRFTAEFSIRTYLEQHEEATLARLREWAIDPNVHVRRLVSEGTRPRLPWAARLRRFQADPTPVLDLLELLKDDPEEYVRRSVANNLNDIAKDHPDVVVATAERWWAGADDNRRRLIRHGLRSLIKQANSGALAVLGFDSTSPVGMTELTVHPTNPTVGGTVRIEVTLTNPGPDTAGALADLVVHFVKANGSTAPKVFKGGEFHIAAGDSATFRKTISLRQQSTRTHYPGEHRVDLQLNGIRHPGATFTLT